MALEDAVGSRSICSCRTGGLLLSTQVEYSPDISEDDVLFATSTFSLCELLSLRPSLGKARKVILLSLFSFNRFCISMKTNSTIREIRKRSEIFSLDGSRCYHAWQRTSCTSTRNGIDPPSSIQFLPLSIAVPTKSRNEQLQKSEQKAMSYTSQCK